METACALGTFECSADLESISDYIALDNPEAADRVIAKITGYNQCAQTASRNRSGRQSRWNARTGHRQFALHHPLSRTARIGSRFCGYCTPHASGQSSFDARPQEGNGVARLSTHHPQLFHKQNSD